MGHVIEPASSGRAKCRGCGEKIDKGVLRFGERAPNPFGEGEATYWFHLTCAACRRPDEFLTVEQPEMDPKVRLMAEAGRDHYRLARIRRAERAPSGRAKCRHCREAIPAGSWRIALEIWEEARFSPMGFIHMSCSKDYFGTADILPRIKHFTPGLSPADLGEIADLLGNSSE
ncbi:MAG: hypothetical protein QNI91_05550 [Arenicellales bacterium]|nr:hypothetical protein [Arenicellales bacterium]